MSWSFDNAESKTGVYYACTAARQDIDDLTNEIIEEIENDLIDLGYSGVREDQLEPGIYGLFYLYTASSVPEKYYDSEYVVLGGTIHIEV